MARRTIPIRATPAPTFYGVTGFCSDDYYADQSADDLQEEVKHAAWTTIFRSLDAAKLACENALRADIELSGRNVEAFEWQPCDHGFSVFHEMTETGYFVYPLTVE